jgi:hypothetical protein
VCIVDRDPNALDQAQRALAEAAARPETDRGGHGGQGRLGGVDLTSNPT